MCTDINIKHNQNSKPNGKIWENGESKCDANYL